MVPAARLNFSRRASALAELAAGAKDAPQRLVRSVLYLWQRLRFPLLSSQRAPWGSFEYLREAATHEFVEWLDDRPFNEAAYWLATAYALWVGEDTRAQRALFFTPPELADRVLANLADCGASLTSQHWHDPACGGAAFLVPIAQRMAHALTAEGLTARDQIIRIERNLSGNDLDPVLLDMSRSFLDMALYDLIEAADHRPTFRLFQGDGLTSKTVEALKPDVLACNPPYRKLKANEVQGYRALHGDVLEGQPNIYGLFINRTLQLPQRGGLVGLLTPTSFLSGQSFSKLRSKLLTQADTLRVDMLSDRTSMFVDVEQETAITILRTREPHKVVSAHTRVSVLTPGGKFDNVGEYLLPNSGRPWPIPRAVEDAELLSHAEAAGFRLSDYGYVARVGSLVAYRDKRKRFAKSPTETKNRVIVPLVWATDIAPDGKFEHRRESRYKRTRAYVQVTALTDHGVLTKPVVLLQRLTSSDQRSRLVAAAVPNEWVEEHGAFVCENHVIVLEPTRDDALTPELMAALLNTRSVDRVFRSVSGASNVAVSELSELLLPDPALLAHYCTTNIDLEAAVLSAYGVLGHRGIA